LTAVLAVLAQAAADQLAQAKALGYSAPLYERLTGVLGLLVIMGIAYLMSVDRRRISWRLVWIALAMQAVLAVAVLKTRPGLWLFERVGTLVDALLNFSQEGARFVFGSLIGFTVPVGIPRPDGTVDTSAGFVASTGAFFAFNVLPTIIFLASLMSVLYHLGLMQWVVKGIAWLMQRTMKTSGAETLSASANIFLGQTEAPLVVKPFIATMTNSELFNVMVCGFATAAGGVLAAYTLMLRDVIPSIAGHLLAATLIQTPAAILLAKMIVPETEVPETQDSMHIHVEKTDVNVIEAAASGAAQGVQLAINVAAMLMAFIALIAMLNAGVSWVGSLVGHPDVTLQAMLGTLLRPLAWVMGVPWADTPYVGSLIGIKTILNEFVAYAQFATDLTQHTAPIQPRSAVIASYAILGFANFSSIAIQIGGIGGMAPTRRSDIARLGLRGMVAGNLAAFMSACWAGMLL
jgi:concentrative nucleoside transporter, CNT family